MSESVRGERRVCRGVRMEVDFWRFGIWDLENLV